MIGSQAVTEVQQILGWRTDKAAEILLALQHAQNQRELPGMTFPWFLRAASNIATVAGTVLYLLPTNYIQDSEERDGNIFYFLGLANKSRPIWLKKKSLQDLQEKFLGVWPTSSTDPVSSVSPPGAPTEYVLQGGQIIMYPIPDKVYTMTWYHWGKAATITLAAENAWLANTPWSLIGDAAYKLASDLENVSAMKAASEIIARAERDLFRAVIARDEAGRKRSMGSRL